MLNRSKKNYSLYNALSGRSRNTRRKRNNYRKKFGGTTLSKRSTSPKFPNHILPNPILTNRRGSSRHLRYERL